MSDEALRDHVLTRGVDGKWSVLTEYLRERFQTDKVELNEAWAETWSGWQCPACGRDKIDIARLTDQGVLLCQLDLHHDHLREAVSPIIRAALPDDLPDAARNLRRAAFSACRPLIERFAETLVCNDCNAADGAMKNTLGDIVPRHFSFTPGEISAFITPEPNQPHGLDTDIGYEVFLNAKPQYEDRLAFAAFMAKRIAAGRHDKEQRHWGSAPRSHAQMLASLAGDLPPRERPSDLHQALLDRSRATDGRSSSRSTKRPIRVRTPTIAEFDALDAKHARTSPWRRASADWQCPGCARTKFEIMRLSNKGTWIAQIMTLHDFREELDPESLQRRYAKAPLPLILGERVELLVCHDCRQIVTDALTAKLGSDQHCLHIEDIRHFATDAQPHQRHPADPQAIAARVEGNGDWIAAVKDFLIHRQEATDIDLSHYQLMRRTGLSADGARDIIIPQLVRDGKLPEKDAAGWFDWFIRQRRRWAGDIDAST
jgi:rubredoxin